MASVFHSIKSAPLIVITSRPYEDITSEWNKFIITQAFGFGIFSILLMLMTLIAVRRQTKLLKKTQELQVVNELLSVQKEKLHELAFIDGLTGVANRRRFDEALDAEWKRCRRDESFLTVVMIDIDHFKLFNDHYGHQHGDACLRQVANAIKGHLHRSHDLVARYGGEEFVCLLPQIDSAGGQSKADELRGAVAALTLPHAASPTAPIVTISLGVATVTPTGSITPEYLIQVADQQLYQAKVSGRNCVCASRV